MGIRFTDVGFEDRVVLSSLGLAWQAEDGRSCPLLEIRALNKGYLTLVGRR